MNFALVLLLTLVFPSFAFAQIDLGEGITITNDQIKQIEAALPRTKEDRFFIHWTNKATGMRWLSQGAINSGEVNFYNKPTGDRQVYGPGIYLAEDATSSKSFGEVPVSFKVTKDTPIYDDAVIKKIIGKSLSTAQASKLGEQIPMLRHATNDWFVINHSMHTDELVYGKIPKPVAKVYVMNPENWTQFKVPGDFKELVQNGDPAAVYLKNIIEASDYMDGISFARAMYVNPSQPWGEFEPENFPKYQQAVKEIVDRMPDFKQRGLPGLEQTMLEVQTIFSGKKDVTDLTQVLRTEGIRAGGDEAGKTFLATEAQLKTMQANPYIEVVSTPQGKNHLVHYFYPDVFHYQKLKGKISDELYEKLFKMSGDELMNNRELRRSLNRQLVDELLNDFIKRMREGKAQWADLISIHPFEDMNGRTSRMIQEIFENGKNHFILGDIDILLPVEEQKIYWERAAKAQQNMQAELIDEFLTARAQNRMPDYLKTGTIQDYLDNSFPTPMHIDLGNNETRELIKTRQWVKVLETGKEKGIKELKLALDNPKKAEKAFTSLMDVTRSDVLRNYTPAEKLELTGMVEKQVRKQDIPVNINVRMEMFKNYEEMLTQIPEAERVKFASPLKIKYDLIMGIKAKVMDPKVTQVDLMQSVSAVFQIEKDQTRVLNYYLSMYNKKTPKEAADFIGQYLNVYANNIQGDADMFKAMKPAEQKRFLVTLKAIVEKFIEVGNKKNGTEGIEKYRELYALADKSVTDVLPDADKLRSWTKKGGFAPCSLMEMLTKLGP